MPDAVKAFETKARKKLTAVALGQPEDAIRGPAEMLLRDLAASLGTRPITVVPETPDPTLAVRPDMSILRGALIGHVELKAPGKGADPTRFGKGHDRDQWEKLKALPNLIYFDGEEISLWQKGEFAHGVLRFGSLAKGGLVVPPGLDALLTAFLTWSPIPPRSVSELAQQTAQSRGPKMARQDPVLAHLLVREEPPAARLALRRRLRTPPPMPRRGRLSV